MSKYLAKGGQVTMIPRGQSAHKNGEEPSWIQNRIFVDPASKRTPIPEIVKAMEERRLRIKKKKSPKHRKKSHAKQKIIYDDFGEPLRKVWIDE
tara:strand:- start:84 stop:365 length:282 start_codon:yes stop_codon:yes gene_type:complete